MIVFTLPLLNRVPPPPMSPYLLPLPPPNSLPLSPSLPLNISPTPLPAPRRGVRPEMKHHRPRSPHKLCLLCCLFLSQMVKEMVMRMVMVMVMKMAMRMVIVMKMMMWTTTNSILILVPPLKTPSPFDSKGDVTDPHYDISDS